MEYQKLVLQYQNLSEDIRNALLIYKTKISYCINEISSIENFEILDSNEILNKIKNKDMFMQIYNKYKLILSDYKNLFVKHSIFSLVNFENEIDFIQSLKHVYNIINKGEKIVTENDLKLYRLVSIDEKEEFVSKGNLISTTLNPDVCEDFVVEGKTHILYELSLPKNSEVLICPFAIKSHFDLENTTLELSNKENQEELIINKNDYNFEITNEKEVILESKDKLIIKKMNLIQKQKNAIK